MAILAMTPALVLAAAQKIDLVPHKLPRSPIPPGGGFVISNNSE